MAKDYVSNVSSSWLLTYMGNFWRIKHWRMNCMYNVRLQLGLGDSQFYHYHDGTGAYHDIIIVLNVIKIMCT